MSRLWDMKLVGSNPPTAGQILHSAILGYYQCRCWEIMYTVISLIMELKDKSYKHIVKMGKRVILK